MRTDKSGFSSVGLVLVITILAIGLIGGYVYRTRSKPTLSSSNNNQSPSTPAQCSQNDLSQYCIEKAEAEEIAFSKLPTDVKAIAIAEIQKQAPECVKAGKLVDITGEPIDPTVNYAPVGSAIIGIGCDGGSAGLFAKDLKSGQWKFVSKTQFGFTCDDIFNNPVPKKLLELTTVKAECLDNNNNFQTYDAESAKRFE